MGIIPSAAQPQACSEIAGFSLADTRIVSALEKWVENGKAPERIIASKALDGRIVRTRPLCPYPQSAHYRGTGSTDDAASFECAE